MADNAIIKIMTALLKHQVKKLVGDEILGVAGQELAAVGGDKIDEYVKSWLGEKTNAAEIRLAADNALNKFREQNKEIDTEVKQWLAALPIHNLPEVLSAIETLPASSDEARLEDALRKSIELNWKKLSPTQIDNLVNAFLSSLRSALLPLEKQTLMIIGRSVLQTQEKLDQLALQIFEYFNKILSALHPFEVKPQPANARRSLENFVGRENLVRDIHKSLDSEKASMVAIIGMGGTGKTSTLLEVAEFAKDKFINNVFFADLDKSGGSENPILMSWIDLCGGKIPSKESSTSLADKSRSSLEKRRADTGPVLVLIDDLRLEWLNAGKALLDSIPENIPVVITTRDIAVVDSLSITSRFDVDSEYSFSDSESRLLLEINSEGTISRKSKEAQEIADVCENMPLALDIAAQFARSKGVHDLLTDLRNKTWRLGRLQKGSRKRKEESVKITFDISYNALSDEEKIKPQLAFRCLGAFAPVGIAAKHLGKILAEADNDINIRDSLYRLQERSLIRLADPNPYTNESIYRMHALLHDYAKGLLKSGEATQSQRRHFELFYDFTRAHADVDLTDRKNGVVWEFEAFYPQMMQALENFEQEYVSKKKKIAGKHAKSGIDFITIMDRYWALHNKYDDQIKWLGIAFDLAKRAGLPLKQADFARRIGRVYGSTRELEDGIKWMKKCETALGKSASKEATVIRAQMHIHRAVLKFQMGDPDKAERDCTKGLKMITDKNQPATYAEGCNILGVIKSVTGDFSAAVDMFDKSLKVWQKIGDQVQVYRVEENIRSALYDFGDMASLKDKEETGLKYWEQFQDSFEYASASTNCGLVYYRFGEYGKSVELYEKSIKLHEQAIERSDKLGYLRGQALARLNLAWPYIALGRYDEAEEMLKESLKRQEEHDLAEYEADARRCLAEVEIGRKNYAKAIELAEIALNLAKEDDDGLEIGSAAYVLGQAHRLSGDLKQAGKYLKQSEKTLRDEGRKYEIYLATLEYGKLYQDMGQDKKAQKEFDEAQALAKEIGLESS